MTDALVVGAGPAGSATALLLARAGRSVRILERAAFPRRKVCGEYLNAGAVDALARLGVLEAVRAHACELRGVRILAAGAPVASLPFARPALACARETLDAVLLDAALAAGAQLERAQVSGVTVEGGRCVGVRARAPDGSEFERRAGVVIGADGSGSTVARKLGLARAVSGGRFAVGGHYEGFVTDAHVEMYVGDGAYFALNPLSPTRTNVMVVVPRARLAEWSADLDAGLGRAAAALARGAHTFEHVRRAGARVSTGPLAHAVHRTVAPGALLVGDAAGFVDPFTGQGVLLALTGAEHAARAVLCGEFAEYAAWRAADAAWRTRLSRAVGALVALPPLARRASARLERFPQAGAVLLDALGGSVPPQRAFAPAVLGRLLA